MVKQDLFAVGEILFFLQILKGLKYFLSHDHGCREAWCAPLAGYERPRAARPVNRFGIAHSVVNKIFSGNKNKPAYQSCLSPLLARSLFRQCILEDNFEYCCVGSKIRFVSQKHSTQYYRNSDNHKWTFISWAKFSLEKQPK